MGENGDEPGLKITAIDRTPDAISLSNSTHFAPMSGSSTPNPVIIPPG